jgi:hypothetical protein
LLTKEEYEKATSLVKDKPTPKDFYNLYYFLRRFVFLDWSEKEILKGRKKLRAGKRIYLDQALVDKSLVKLDVWAEIPYPDMKGKRYIEVTNWIVMQVEVEGEVETLSIIQEDRIKSLKADIFKLAGKDPLKMSKRYWNYLLELEELKLSKAARNKVESELVKLAPLFSSYIAFLNSVATDIELSGRMLSLKLITRKYYLDFLTNTRTRMKQYAPGCYFDAKLNDKLITHLDHNIIFNEVARLSAEYLNEHKIDALAFVV